MEKRTSSRLRDPEETKQKGRHVTVMEAVIAKKQLQSRRVVEAFQVVESWGFVGMS